MDGEVGSRGVVLAGEDGRVALEVLLLVASLLVVATEVERTSSLREALATRRRQRRRLR